MKNKTRKGKMLKGGLEIPMKEQDQKKYKERFTKLKKRKIRDKQEKLK